MAARSSTPDMAAFTSDRMRLMRPLLTPRVLDLALRRVTERGFKIARRTEKETLYCEGTETERKLALIVALEINPRELINDAEEVILYGEGRAAIASKKARGELP